MVPFFDNRADIIWKVLARDRFVNIGILPNDNSIKLNRAAKLGISVCSRITRLMNNPTKSQIKATIPQKKSKRREECCGSCENCTTIGLRLARLGSIGFSKGKTFPGKPGAKSQFERYGSPSLRYVKQVSGKTKDNRFEKYKSNILISEVLTQWTSSTGPMKRLKHNSDVPEAQKQAQRERQSYLPLARGRKGTPGCVSKRAGGKRVCGGFRSSYACGQQERP